MFALPLAATLLPWRWSLRLMRLLSRWPGWYVDEVALSTEHAQRAGMAPDPEAFARRLRWRLLIDNLDGFLVPMRSRRYLRRWLQASGDPLPERGPLMVVGTHHGCGYWFLPYMRSRGLPLNIVAPQLGPLLVRASLLENIFVRLRHRLIARAGGRPMVYRGNAAEATRQLLRRGEVSFGLADMPTNRRDAVAVQLAGLPTRLAPNMFELAADERIPVYLFWSDTDLATGTRRVHFQRMPDGSTPEEQVRAFAAMLDELIARDPTGWRFWSIAPSFFGDALPQAPRQAERVP
jgi:hypothetical protein